jgi:hypothetical protein
MTFWMNRLRKKNIENIAAGSSIIATKLAARDRLANTRNGSKGWRTRDSTRKNSASRTAPPTRLAMVSGCSAVRGVPGA